VSVSKPPFLAIAAPVREEAGYLLEWIAYHRVLGVKIFLLADNGGSDGTSKFLAELEEARVISRFDWREEKNFQMPFYGQALEAARSFVDGMFFIDVDEFLRPSDAWLADAKRARPDASLRPFPKLPKNG